MLGVVGIGVSAAVPGCQDATQATITITLEKQELCPNLGGTAITVGVEPRDTEQRVANSYVTAVENKCDPATGLIGSLVITPGDTGRSSVVVVVAFDKARAQTPADCKPPGYAGCVVARRLFSFPDHKNLQMPITVDAACVDVPCDAVSTCRRGNCYSAEVLEDCVGLACEPGVSEDGGVPDGGIVEAGGDGPRPDGSTNDAAGDDGSMSDGSMSDGSTSDGSTGGAVPYCTTAAMPVLMCEKTAAVPTSCGGATPACCGAGVPTVCMGACPLPERRCCSNPDCGMGGCCPPSDGGTAPRFCLFGGPVIIGGGKNPVPLASSCADPI